MRLCSQLFLLLLSFAVDCLSACPFRTEEEKKNLQGTIRPSLIHILGSRPSRLLFLTLLSPGRYQRSILERRRNRLLVYNCNCIQLIAYQLLRPTIPACCQYNTGYLQSAITNQLEQQQDFSRRVTSSPSLIVTEGWQPRILSVSDHSALCYMSLLHKHSRPSPPLDLYSRAQGTRHGYSTYMPLSAFARHNPSKALLPLGSRLVCRVPCIGHPTDQSWY